MLYFTNPPALSDEEQEKFQRILDRYVHDALFTSTTPLECVRAVHRLIQQNVIYPRQRLRMEGAVSLSVLPESDEGRHYISAYGALVNERATSYGIARAVDAILCDPRIGIESQLVEGCILAGDAVPSMHLWNIVTVGHKSYHIDTACEIMTNPQAVRRTGEPGLPLEALASDELPMIEALLPSYQYCLVSDDIMRSDHLWRAADTPSCLSSYVPVGRR